MTDEIRFEGYIGYNLTAQYIREKIKDTQSPRLLINSVGGSVYDGNAIINEMQFSGKKVVGVVIGMAASMAGVVLQKCDRRIMYENATLMLHRVSSAVYGNADQIIAEGESTKEVEEQIIDAYVKRSGKTAKYIRDKYFTGADNWLTAKQALKEGFIDEIIPDKFSISTPANFAQMNLQGRLNFYATNQVANYKESSHQNLNTMDYKEQFEAEQKKAKALQEQLDKANAEKAEVLVNAAIEAGKINQSQKAIYIISAKTDFEGTKNALNAIVVTPSLEESAQPTLQTTKVNDLLNRNAAQNASDTQPEKDFEWYQKNDPDALVEMEAKNNAAFERLRNDHALKISQKFKNKIKA